MARCIEGELGQERGVLVRRGGVLARRGESWQEEEGSLGKKRGVLARIGGEYWQEEEESLGQKRRGGLGKRGSWTRRGRGEENILER